MIDVLNVVHHSPEYTDVYYVSDDGDWDRVNQQRVWAYAVGRIKPRYPLPVTLDTADIAIGWIRLSVCPFEHPCNVCLDNYMDDLTYHFPEAFD